MELKKSDKANLESKRRIFTEIGFIIVLVLLFGAFEYSSRQSDAGDLGKNELAAPDEELPPVSREDEPKPDEPEPEEEPEEEPPEEPEVKETDDKTKDESDKMKAQDDNKNQKIADIKFEEDDDLVEEKIFMRVEKQPSFPGGPDALRTFIGRNLVYPQEAVDMGLEGKVVVKFVVNEKGEAVKPVVLKKVSPELDQAAMDVIKKLPLFTPGEQAGKKVKVYYIVPIDFQLAR